MTRNALHGTIQGRYVIPQGEGREVEHQVVEWTGEKRGKQGPLLFSHELGLETTSMHDTTLCAMRLREMDIL